MKYKTLIDLGFKRHNMGDNIDIMGFEDFYLHLKVSKEITFEWHWENPKIVKMVRYKKHDVLNYLEIIDLQTLKSLISLFTEKHGNNKPKQQIGFNEGYSLNIQNTATLA